MEYFNQEVLFEGKIYLVLYQYDTGFIEIREKDRNLLSDVKLVHMSEVTFQMELPK